MRHVSHTLRARPARSPRRRWADAGIAAGLFLFALGLRAYFLHQMLATQTFEDVIRFNWDSREYVHLAQNLAARGQYVYDTDPPAPADVAPAAPRSLPPPSTEPHTVSHFFGLLRTPGYPMFCAIIMRCCGSMTAVLWVQVVLGSLIPVGVFFLGLAMLRHRGVGTAAAIVSVISPTGVGLAGMFLVDLLFAACVIGGFALLYLATARGRWRLYIGAGVVFAVGLLVKPALLYWPLALLPAAGFLLAANGSPDQRPGAWRRLAVTALIPLLAAAAWCARNRMVEHEFTFCSVDAQNLRHFLAPLTEEWARAGHEPAVDDIWKNHFAARDADWADMAEGRLTAAQVARRQRSQTWAILRQHPWVAIHCMFNCGTSASCMGWPYTRDQLPQPTFLHDALFAIDHLMNPTGTRVAYAVMLVGLLEPLLAGRRWRDPENHRRACIQFALLTVLLYFLLLAGTSFSTGFRILYPIEFTMILLTASGALAIGRIFQRITQSAADREPADLVAEVAE